MELFKDAHPPADNGPGTHSLVSERLNNLAVIQWYARLTSTDLRHYAPDRGLSEVVQCSQFFSGFLA